MKIIATGILAFVVWSGASTYWYLNKIIDFKDAVAVPVILEFTEEKESEPIPEGLVELIKNPGIFILRHEFDQLGFIKESTLEPFIVQMTTFLEQNANSKINITGYTDDRGSTEYNQILARKRADAARDFLMEHGIPNARIQVQAKGEDDPVTENSTEEGRALNRRTTIEIN